MLMRWCCSVGGGGKLKSKGSLRSTIKRKKTMETPSSLPWCSEALPFYVFEASESFFVYTELYLLVLGLWDVFIRRLRTIIMKMAPAFLPFSCLMIYNPMALFLHRFSTVFLPEYIHKFFHLLRIFNKESIMNATSI